MRRKYMFLYVHIIINMRKLTILNFLRKKKNQAFPLKMLTWESLHAYR